MCTWDAKDGVSKLSRAAAGVRLAPLTVRPYEVRMSANAHDMLRFDLANENETIRNYRARVRQCEALGEYAMAEEIREILRTEQEHQIDLSTALDEDVPELDAEPR
jgi:bacterioferritin